MFLKGSQVEFSKLCCISETNPEGCFNLRKCADSDEMQHFIVFIFLKKNTVDIGVCFSRNSCN